MTADALPYVPAADVLPGVELMQLPEGHTPLSAIVLMKTLDDDGEVAWITRYAKDLGGIECLGALHAAVLTLSEDIKRMYRREPDEDE